MDKQNKVVKPSKTFPIGQVSIVMILLMKITMHVQDLFT